MYNIDYYENLLRRYSKTAFTINTQRWVWILNHCSPRTVLDYGSGVGWFRAYRPESVLVDSYDIAPVTQTGITQDYYDLICFWDVLEHMEITSHKLEKLLTITDAVAGTIPIAENFLQKGNKLEDWKHYKPGEHVHYFCCSSLDAYFENKGFVLINRTMTWECPPREDILTFFYRRAK